MENSILPENNPWYAIRLFTLRLKEVKSFFEEAGYKVFVPEQYEDFEDREGKRHHELRPVVRNLLFVEKKHEFDLKDAEIMDFVQGQDKYKIAVLRPNPTEKKPALIPAYQMREFIMMCNPEITMKIFVSSEEAKLKTGDFVTVHHGPLKGMTGRLVRKSKKYYLLKEIPGISVMMKVSRWCCEPIDPDKLKESKD